MDFNIDLALVHYPVCNRQGEITCSAVTNLDLHDIARAGRTFGVDNFYVVTPYREQHRLVRDILSYWIKGHGAVNKARKEALSRIRLCDDLAALLDRIVEKRRQRPTVLATCAQPRAEPWSFGHVRERVRAGESFLLLFGTAWGLAPEVFHEADGILPPITGSGDYNHLSVRSAVAIVLDRLLGMEDS